METIRKAARQSLTSPRELGVFVYNADFDYLEKYSLSTKSIGYFQEELQKLHEGKTWYSVCLHLLTYP